MSSAGELESTVDEIPSREVCQRLVEKFAEITQTDEACAQFYLQDRKWQLEPSLDAYFKAKQGGINILMDADEPEVVITFDKRMTESLSKTLVTTEPPDKFSLLTWNIDGLDERNLKKRTKAVVKVIEMDKPDIVFLQEVIPATYSYIESHLPHYMCLASGCEDYFNATLLHRTTVYFDGHQLKPFKNSVMGRSLLMVEAHIGRAKLHLLNTHLESTADFAKERTEQLVFAFDMLKSKPKDTFSVLAGDLNLRDKELSKIGGIPLGAFDAWEALGRRPECQYTWDLTRNTNKEVAGKFKPRLRFDRVYCCSSLPSYTDPVYFGLVGIQKVSGTQSFPSDHWGIIVNFQILKDKLPCCTPSEGSNSRRRDYVQTETDSETREVEEVVGDSVKMKTLEIVNLEEEDANNESICISD